MPRAVLPLAATVLALGVPSTGAQDLPEEVAAAPPSIRAEAEAADGRCRAAGGEPTITDDFLRRADLDGDGTPDYLVDLFGFWCEGAPAAVCDATGCPVSVWLSAGGEHAVAWRGVAMTSRIEGGAVVLDLHASLCEPRGESCERRLTFGAEADTATGGTLLTPLPRPADVEAVSDEPVGGWTLRAVPDGDPVAVSDGPGLVATLAAFCLGGEPWLALTLEPPPEAVAVQAGFAFAVADRSVAAEALREDGAGGAYVIEVAEHGLAGLLAGRDSTVALSIDGAEQGVLSLDGSTRAIRGALAPCGGVD